MKFWWLYVCRHGDETLLFPGTHEGFEAARKAQDRCNGITPEEIEAEGYGEVYGSEEEGVFSIDDGGEIRVIELEEL